MMGARPHYDVSALARNCFSAMNQPLTPGLPQEDPTARVYDVAVESALEPARNLSRRLHNQGAAQARGPAARVQLQTARAYNKMAQLAPEQLQRGVICASAGNHAQGVAMSAHSLGTRAVIVMPTTTPAVKIDAVRTGRRGGAAWRQLFRRLRPRRGAAAGPGPDLVHPFDDPDVIAGQGTMRWKSCASCNPWAARADAVFVAIGGGGLVSGVANYIKAVRPEVKVIGVQMNDSGRHDAKSVQAGKARYAGPMWACSPTARPSSWWARKPSASPAAGGRVHHRGHRRGVRGHQDIFVDTRSIVEPAGLAVAAIKQYATHKTKGETYAAILCGANMNFDRLRFVAERAEVGEEREALLAVTIPEERGSFRRFAK